MPTGGLGKSQGIDSLLLHRFSDLVRERWGLHYPEAKQAELSKAIQHGCLQSQCRSLAEYLELLISDTEPGIKACDDLTGILTIGETYFFRYMPQFRDLTDHLLPELIARRRASTRHLHIWSAGAATGEEAYSVAILLRELLPDIDDWKIEVLATDINRHFLERAHRGLYRGWSFREEGLDEITQRYFWRLDDGSLQVIDPIRDMVNFQLLNLVTDAYPVATDLILCRNVLIYFSVKTAHRIIDRFYDALTPGGYLLLGHTESSPYVTRKFPGVVSYNTLSYRKAPTYRPAHSMRRAPEPSRASGQAERSGPVATAVNAPGVSPLPQVQSVAPGGIAEAETLVLAGKHDEALPLLSALAADEGAAARVWTLYGKLMANQGRLDEALDHLRQAIAIDPCDLEANYLSSVIHRELGQTDEAIRTLKRTVYLDHNLAIAHFDLGNIYAERGDRQSAQRHWRTARQILGGQEEVTAMELEQGVTKGQLQAVLATRLQR